MHESCPVHRPRPAMVRTPAVIVLLMLLLFCQVFGAISLTQSLHSYLNWLSPTAARGLFPYVVSPIVHIAQVGHSNAL
jgi:hypothetical protein